MSIKRVIFYILSIILCFLLQTAVFDFLRLADTIPNILLILTVTMGFIQGKKTGIVIGFVCGLLMDVYFGEVVGQYALLYLLFGYVNGWFHAHFFEDEILLPIGLLAANSLVYSLVVFFFFFTLRGRFHFLTYLIHVIIPEAVYTGIVALILYKILLAIDVRISDGEKRSMF